MTRNMGNLDRAVRTVVALVLAWLAYTQVLQGTLAIIAWVVAAVFLVTSLISFCPLYRLLGSGSV